MRALDFNHLIKAPPGIIFVPFLPEHTRHLKVEQRDVTAFGPSDIQEMLSWQSKQGLAITVLKHGKPIGIWGSVKIWDGVEEAWFVTEELTRQYAVSMTRVAKLFISLRFQEASLHRLQITVRCDDKRAERWAKCLGFHTEGTMKGFGPDGADFYMMAITKEK